MNLTAPKHYTSHYCEENVWHLLQDPLMTGTQRHTVFISNAKRACPVWMQQSSPSPQEPVLWDYHVVALSNVDEQGWHIWDLDTRLPWPCLASAWLNQSFPHALTLATLWQPQFRMVEAAVFLSTFASDRSHMRAQDGQESWPAPPAPPINTAQSTMNLWNFVDMETTFVGRVFTLDALRAWLTQNS